MWFSIIWIMPFMEMCECDEILMALGITQLLLNYNSFLQDSEASIVAWLISLLYYQCFYWTYLISMDISIVAEYLQSLLFSSLGDISAGSSCLLTLSNEGCCCLKRLFVNPGNSFSHWQLHGWVIKYKNICTVRNGYHKGGVLLKVMNNWFHNVEIIPTRI